MASATDFYSKTPFAWTPSLAPAVDGLNGKALLFGGSIANHSVVAAAGAVSFPVQGQFGAQIDGMLGGYGSQGLGSVAGHLFWRDPAVALIGLYLAHTGWDKYGGAYANHVGIEGAVYWDRWTLEGVVGVESGNRVASAAGPVIYAYDVSTRFFDVINLAYYPQDNLRLSIGHRYLGGRNAFAIGGEWGLPVHYGTTMASVFAEGRLAEGSYGSIWGGVKVYVGQRDKTLLQRHRRDDPPVWATDTISTLGNSRQ
jgi:hypothetical protein